MGVAQAAHRAGDRVSALLDNLDRSALLPIGATWRLRAPYRTSFGHTFHQHPQLADCARLTPGKVII